VKQIVWTDHAKDKLRLIQNQGFVLDEDFIEDSLRQPEHVVDGYLGRLIAQSALDEQHTIRIVYEETDVLTVVTLYPGRRSRYES
jgi:hypothetical protein